MGSVQATIHNSSELENLSDQILESVTHLRFVSGCCNELTSLNLNRFNKLELIEIGDECFENVNEFKIDRLNHLKSIKIGINSFTKENNSWGNDESRFFSV